jgi:hypothetical protein
MSNDVIVTINPAKFQRGLQSARALRGVFDPATKTWRIPAAMAEFIGPRNPGLVRVAPVTSDTRCAHYTRDQGCPLHGETCPSAR